MAIIGFDNMEIIQDVNENILERPLGMEAW
jgi:hypothetical protein